MKTLFAAVAVFLSGNQAALSAEVTWNTRLEGKAIFGGNLLMEDEDFALLGTDAFTDHPEHCYSYVRLGLAEVPGMTYTAAALTTYLVTVRITPYSDANAALPSFTQVLKAEYRNTGAATLAIDAHDYRLANVHKFRVEVQSVTINGVTATATAMANYVYLEAGFYAERYYKLDETLVPSAFHNYITYSSAGVETIAYNQQTTATDNLTDEIELSWEYVPGAEYYDLEWTWVDNYSDAGLSTVLSTGDIDLTEQEFIHNSTRIRTGMQHYRIPQLFARGYLIYRVRGVGRWATATSKDKYGKWSDGAGAKTFVSDWPHIVEIGYEHEDGKNWQYQSTYAENGKKKEVVQYFDGTLRGRQTVTRINSDNHSVVGETIYDNEGRGVIQVLPVPQQNPGIKYYPDLNNNSTSEPYSHQDFDWEGSSVCGPAPAGAMNAASGAANYYSTAAHTTDTDWQQYVPDAKGFPFSQVEYTPDNTGRIRSQSGTGDVHKIGDGHETRYYYTQAEQEELNRLFGYKVGNALRYKKNMVVDANGQVSISYLDPQGRVVATALAGDNATDFVSLDSESGPQHGLLTKDLLNKLVADAEDTPLDNNIPFSTGTIGALNDGLKLTKQIAVAEQGNFDFTYKATSDYFEYSCDETTLSYPFVYDVRLSLTDDCGTNHFETILTQVGVEAIGAAIDDYLEINQAAIPLAQGTYTLFKEITVNQASLQLYREHFLSEANTCLADDSLFLQDVNVQCNMTCRECADALGTPGAYLAAAELNEGHTLTTEETAGYTSLYNQLLEACVAPCRPLTNCDVYFGMLRADMMPNGQYGSLDPTDVLSVYNTANHLGGHWKSVAYTNADGTPALIAVTYDGTSYSPAITTTPAAPANLAGIYNVPPTELVHASDFAQIVQPEWAGALVQFHPEYYLYEYALDICNMSLELAATSETTSDAFVVSSEIFDAILRDNAHTYAQAINLEVTLDGFDYYTINLLQAGELDDIDPFFNQAYPKHSSVTAGLKNDLMDWAMNNYENDGLSLMQFAAKTVLHGNSYSTSVAYPTTWAAMALAYPQQIDAIWEAYKSYYLSYKGKINQLYMDLYGFGLSGTAEHPIVCGGTSPFVSYESIPAGLFNGAIGTGGVSIGIAPAFQADAANFFTVIQEVTSSYFSIGSATASCGTSYTYSSGPAAFGGNAYNSKQIRIVRIDALYNPALPDPAIIDQLTADADYATWSQTGLCPLVLDMELLLNALAADDAFLSVSTMEAMPELTPDLYTALSGLLPGTPGGAMTITGTASGSPTGTTLDLTFTAGSSTQTFVLSQPGSNSWANYGTGWHIYSVSNSYPDPLTANTVQLLVLAGATPETAIEYVISYVSPVDVNSCQADYTANGGAYDPNCRKEEEFEAAVLALMQRMLSDGTFYSTVSITNLPEFYNSVLPRYLGGGSGSWTGPGVAGFPPYSQATISGSGASIQLMMASSFSTTITAITSVDVVGNDLYITAISDAGTPELITYTGSIFDKKGVLRFACNCEELAAFTNTLPSAEPVETAMLNLLNYLLGQSSVPNGSSPGEADALADYLLYGEDTIKLYHFEQTDNSLSVDLYADKEPTCSISIDVPFTENPALAVVSFDALTINRDKTYTLTVNYGNGLQETFTGIFDCLVLPAVECDYCNAQPEPPIACNEVYKVYDEFMTRTFGDIAEDSLQQIFEEEYLTTDSLFCAASYAYISEAYQYYIALLNIASLNDSLFLTISEFGATPLGYSNIKLSAAVTAFEDYLDTAANTSITWNYFVTWIYLPAHPEICPATTPQVTFPNTPTITPCDQWQTAVAVTNQQTQYGIYLAQLAASFTQDYVEKALSSLVEECTMTGNDKEYHYTLYYYDRAGNLGQTVPPQGVTRFDGQPGFLTNDQIDLLRANDPEAYANVSGGVTRAPAHELATIYRYNSLNQLVYQHTPDGGVSQFAYDHLGRIVASQNAQQRYDSKFSYSCYDALGRVVEAGVFTTTTSGIYAITVTGRLVLGFDTTSELNVTDAFWINTLPLVSRSEVTRSIYDELKFTNGTLTDVTAPIAGGNTLPLTSLFGADYSANNTRNRIVGVIYQNVYNADLNTYNSGTFYDYDVHGNVKHLVQVTTDAELLALNHHLKHLEYTYDLVSGNVNKVYYQKGQEDQFIHRYAYDSDNRITHAETSKDDVYFERDAKYFYYDHGPLARTETGHRKLQSQDYAYTIQGWLKTVNGEQVDESTMMGGDGKATGLNMYGGRDVSGYSLSYFNGDYSSSNTAMLNFSLSTVTAPNAGPGLYNGNIRAMYTGLSKTDELALKTHQTKYAYDQLNRIKSMDGQIISNGATPTYAPSGYESAYSFDANGNLKTLKRYAHNGTTGFLMDEFEYHYTAGTNQLDYVYDNAGVSTSGDIGNTQTAGNYDYDAIGQLTADEDEGITGIAWTVTNKVKQVTKADGTVIRFDYDAMGHRIAKKVITPTGTKTTYYVLDAQGNPMSIYEGITEADETYKLYLAERNIYGSSRIGTEKVNLEMNEASLQGYLPLNPIETIGLGELCTTTGEWYYEQTSTTGSLLDFNGDGNQDIKFSDATMASTGYSAQIGAHVVRGATYTLDFDLLNKTNVGVFSFEVRDCSSGTVYINQVVTPGFGHASAVFTVPYDKSDQVRIKWLAQKSNPVSNAHFTISQLSLDGEGTEFDVMAAAQYGAVAHVIGDKYYEVANHLGNVLEVIRDIKLASNGGSGSVVAYSQPDVVSYSDYYPYGMQMPGRHDQNVYRYGFQGQEKDDEIKGGEGTSLNYEYRMHDPRVGRFFAVDPLAGKYPWNSPYAFSENVVINAIELEGLEQLPIYQKGTEPKVQTPADPKPEESSLQKSIDSYKKNTPPQSSGPINRGDGKTALGKYLNQEFDKSKQQQRDQSVTPPPANSTLENATTAVGITMSAADGVNKYNNVTPSNARSGFGSGAGTALTVVDAIQTSTALVTTIGRYNENPSEENLAHLKGAAADAGLFIFETTVVDRALSSGYPPAMIAAGIYYIGKFIISFDDLNKPFPALPENWDELKNEDNTRIGEGTGF